MSNMVLCSVSFSERCKMDASIIILSLKFISILTCIAVDLQPPWSQAHWHLGVANEKLSPALSIPASLSAFCKKFASWSSPKIRAVGQCCLTWGWPWGKIESFGRSLRRPGSAWMPPALIVCRLSAWRLQLSRAHLRQASWCGNWCQVRLNMARDRGWKLRPEANRYLLTFLKG